MSEIIYAWDKVEGQYVKRHPGKRYGDGQQDTDERPVWLVSSEDEVRAAGLDPDTLPEIDPNGPAAASL